MEAACKAFEAEVQAMAKLRSKYIVQFYGYCLSPKYTIVMEFMSKGALTRLLLSKNSLNWDLRALTMTDMAYVLNALHSKNILHRDIKSLNVLLDEQFRAILSDFGMSKIKTETRTSTKSIGGTIQKIVLSVYRDTKIVVGTIKVVLCSVLIEDSIGEVKLQIENGIIFINYYLKH